MARSSGTVVGDRNYWRPSLREGLAQVGITLRTPCRWASRDPVPQQSRRLSRMRYRNDNVFGQLIERCHVKRIWARNAWHLWNRLHRVVLMHTLAFLLNVRLGNPPLQLARLVA